MNCPTTLGLRVFTFSTAILVTAAAVVVPAGAAEPTNDSILTPTVVTTIPSTFSQDTSEATHSASDGRCVAGASVWYRYRPAETDTARVVTFGSNFDTLLAVFSGPRKNRELVACADDTNLSVASAAAVRFVGGKVYWIAVSACCSGPARGGESVLRLYRPRPAGVAMTLDAVAAGTVSGRLFVSGTITCETPSDGFVGVSVSQRVGESAVARGTEYFGVSGCTHALVDWKVSIDSETGWAFEEGTAAVDARAVVSDGFQRVRDVHSVNLAVTSDPN